jgi:deoxyribonuclease V
MEDIYEEIYSLVRQIPEGMVSTYKRVAEALGDPIAARGVADALSINPRPVEVPCHRVVHEDLTLGGFRFGVEEKKSMLRKEGIPVENGCVRAEVFDGFESDKVLGGMQATQREMSRRVELTDCDFELFGGFDVSYSDRLAKGVLCVMNKRLEVIEMRTEYALSNMPYIPTYLGFRELPLFERLSDGLEGVLYLIDGNGIMHPRFCGSACMMGLRAKAPAIGIAKSRLLGTVEGDAVLYEGRQVGWKKGRLFISPGNRVSLQTTLRLAAGLSEHGAPEPLRMAHLLARISKQR